MELNKHDLSWCVRRLPKVLRNHIKKGSIAVAGGYIRACVTGEQVNDIDLFCSTKEFAKKSAIELVDGDEKRLHTTENAITIMGIRPTAQFITRWVYDNPEDIIKSFDWTICQAAFWWAKESEDEENDNGRWESSCSESFYHDLASKRLIYTFPNRLEAPGGSILRVLKYYQRGYRITLDSFAGVISRVVAGVDFTRSGSSCIVDESGNLDAAQFHKVIKGLLEEVDPNVDPDHILQDIE